MNLQDQKVPVPSLEPFCRISIKLAEEPWPLGEIGTGYSEITAVRGGTVEGKINGTLKDFGADWGLMYQDRVNLLDTKMFLVTDDGANISIESKGILIMSMEELMNGAEGDAMDPENYYFRLTVNFKAGDPRYTWLNEAVFVGSAAITEDGNVIQDVYIVK